MVRYKGSHGVSNKDGHVVMNKAGHVVRNKAGQVDRNNPGHVVRNKAGHKVRNKAGHEVRDKAGHVIWNKAGHMAWLLCISEAGSITKYKKCFLRNYRVNRVFVQFFFFKNRLIRSEIFFSKYDCMGIKKSVILWRFQKVGLSLVTKT